jgi:TetR/AcrR family transcriptional regulator, tetracycline repressor protein
MGRSARLDRDTIVTEALALLQQCGLAEVSLRKLAARLGASAPALARHVGDKGSLLALMSDRLFCEALDTVGPALTGDAWLAAFGQALWAKQRATRDIAGLLASAPPAPDLDHALLETLRLRLAGAGLTGDDAMFRQGAVQALVTGWTTFAQSPRAETIARTTPIEQAFASSLAALIAGFRLA